MSHEIPLRPVLSHSVPSRRSRPDPTRPVQSRLSCSHQASFIFHYYKPTAPESLSIPNPQCRCSPRESFTIPILAIYTSDPNPIHVLSIIQRFMSRRSPRERRPPEKKSDEVALLVAGTRPRPLFFLNAGPDGQEGSHSRPGVECIYRLNCHVWHS